MSALGIAPVLALVLALSAHAAPNKAQQARLDRQFAAIESAGERLTARGIADYVADAAALGGDPDKVKLALERLRSQQELRPGHALYGNFRWYRGQPEVIDRNAVQFVVQTSMMLAHAHPRALGANEPAFRQLMADAAKGCHAQRVRPGYTNIFLMKATNLVLLGQYLGEGERTEQGRALLREWLAHVRREGIVEYNSPTYTGVDLDCGVLLRRFARDPADRALAEAVLRCVWTDAAANWFEPARRLGGSRSRDYDYLRGIGAPFDFHASAAGWLEPLQPDRLGPRDHPRAWAPPRKWTEPIRSQVPREVVQRWGTGIGQQAVHWQTPLYSVGSSGAGKAFDDKVLAVQFGGSRLDPMLYLVMESQLDPYGLTKTPDSNGHGKSLHLRPLIGCVQDKDKVLLVAADDTGKPRHLRPFPELKGLWTHLVFPAAARLVDAAGAVMPEGAALPPGACAFVRKDGVTVGIRLLACADGWDGPGNAGKVAIHRRDGEHRGAARLTWEHGAGPAPGRALVALALETGATPDEAAFRAFAKRFASVPAKTRIAAGKAEVSRDGLGVSLDLAGWKTSALSGGSTLAEGQVMTVNGGEVLAPVIEEALAR